MPAGNPLTPPPFQHAIFTNLERRHRFELATPGWAQMDKDLVRQKFDEFCQTYKDPYGTVNLGPISYEDARCLMG